MSPDGAADLGALDLAPPATEDLGGGLSLDLAAPDSTEVDDPLGALDPTLLMRSFQDVDVIIDPALLGAQRLTLELWSDGAQAEDAGAALRFTRDPDGTVAVSTRRGQALTALASSAPNPLSLLGNARLRLRLRKGAGATSTLHVDLYQVAGYRADAALFALVDDHLLSGRRAPVLEPAGLAAGAVVVTALQPAGVFSLNRTLEGLTDWKLYQRDSSDRAALPLSFAWTLPTRAQLEVQISDATTGAVLPGFAYADHMWRLPPAPSGTGALVSLTGVPAGGNYHVRARLSPRGGGSPLGADQVVNIAVGDVFLAMGQSNMSGFGSLAAPEAPSARVHLFGNDYLWKQASEPIDDPTDQRDRVSEEPAEHSMLLRFAKQVVSGTGVPVAVIPASRYATDLTGGSALSWDRPATLGRGTLYGSAVTRVLAQGYGAPPRGVLYWQGEGDAGAGTDNYLQALQRLVRDLRGDLGGDGVFFGNCQLQTTFSGSGATLDEYLAIQEAQRQGAALINAAAAVAMIDLARDPADPWHLTTPGYQEAGRRLGEAVLHGAFGQSRPLGPVLRAAAFSAGRRDAVELTYDKAVTGGLAALYHFADSKGSGTASTVAVSGAKVTVTLPRATSGATTLSYGYSYAQGAQWVRGADGAGAALVFRALPLP